ncbi:MAG TPA: ribonuclease HI [Thermoplasmata archaeon]|nr:ribonuclease HI [Thermoplasmata archaeon]
MRDEDLPRGIATYGDPGVIVHFDGACQPPKGPGVAGYGFTVEGDGYDHEDHGLATRPYSENSTNNVAEYVAAIRALEWLRSRGYRGPVTAAGDSQLVVRQMRGEYEVRAEHLQAYHDWLAKLAAEFTSVTWQWVPREQNGRADALSKRAIDEHRPTARRLTGASPGPRDDASPERDDADGDAERD